MKKLLFICLLFISCAICGQVVFAQAEPEPSPQAEEQPEKPEKEKEEKYEAHVYFATESLSRDLGTWRMGTVSVQRKFNNRQLVWASYRVSDRNGNRDQEFIGGTYKPLKNRWAFTTEAMFSASHKYVGKFSVMGEAEKVLGKGYVAHFGSRFTKYDTVNATTGYGLIEKYWGSYRGAYTLYVTNLSNAGTAPTHRFQFNRYYGERINSIGAAFSFGKEHENLGPSLGILRSQTWSASFSARHWMTKKFGLSFDGTIHRQGDLYYRKGLTFGARYRF